jgi:hypothetical protein
MPMQEVDGSEQLVIRPKHLVHAICKEDWLGPGGEMDAGDLVGLNIMYVNAAL